MSNYLDAIPRPWVRSDIETAIFKDSNDALAAIQRIDGGKQWKALKDLEDTIWIFHYSITDLLDEISLFSERSKSQTFWNNCEDNAAGVHTRAIKRKIFNCTSSVMTLVDHARKFEKEMPVPNFAVKLKEEFSTPGLHKFLQDFRNYNTHWRIAQANWRLDYRGGLREARFQITKSQLLEWDKWTREAVKFIEQSEQGIDVYDLFYSYREHVRCFYDWHRGAFLDEYANTLGEYLEYKRIFDGIRQRYSWSLLITHAPKNLNPYQYLGRYLSKSQIELLLTLPHRSEEQVDMLINMLGMQEFCNSDLRLKLVELFKGREVGDATGSVL